MEMKDKFTDLTVKQLKKTEEWLNLSKEKKKEIILKEDILKVLRTSHPLLEDILIILNKDMQYSIWDTKTMKIIRKFKTRSDIVDFHIITINRIVEDIRLNFGDERRLEIFDFSREKRILTSPNILGYAPESLILLSDTEIVFSSNYALFLWDLDQNEIKVLSKRGKGIEYILYIHPLNKRKLIVRGRNEGTWSNVNIFNVDTKQIELTINSNSLGFQMSKNLHSVLLNGEIVMSGDQEMMFIRFITDTEYKKETIFKHWGSLSNIIKLDNDRYVMITFSGFNIVELFNIEEKIFTKLDIDGQYLYNLSENRKFIVYNQKTFKFYILDYNNLNKPKIINIPNTVTVKFYAPIKERLALINKALSKYISKNLLGIVIKFIT